MGEEADAVMVRRLFRRFSNCKTWRVRRHILLKEFAPLLRKRGVLVHDEGRLVAFSKLVSGEIFKIAFRDSKADEWRIKCFIAEKEGEIPREYFGIAMEFFESMVAGRVLVRS